MLKIPLGVDDFALMNQKGYFYAIKPGRFTIYHQLTTLEAILNGERELFNGCWIYDSDCDWPVNPVISISLNLLGTENLAALKTALAARLMGIALTEGLTLAGGAPSDIFH